MVLHMMVEELLQLLVDKVDGDLLEAVIFKDLEASDVEHSAEVGLRQSLQTFKVISAFFQQLIYSHGLSRYHCI